MARRVQSRRIIAFAGEGALGGLGLAAAYMVGINFLGLDRVLLREGNSFFQLDTGFLLGAALWMSYRAMDQKRLSEAVYLTVRTSAMVCWLFVGSATFASVFSYLGGQQVITDFVTGLDISPLAFLIIAQLIIFLLGWPLEWTEIIVIFIPIFLPLLPHFGIDPLFFGVLVAVNLQTAFLSPPMAMSAYYIKGIAPPEVRLTQIFAGMMPYMAIVILCMVIIYVFPGLATWLPSVTYGR
jgi:TRAP-type mannitol/chloroaromatic compound transport system permease large subunit